MMQFSPHTKTKRDNLAPLLLVLLAAAAIRLYALQVTAIINPDGAVYIHQARAVALGEWRNALCSLPFLSSYSLLIRLAHMVFPDWLIAARAVSLVFGTLALIPFNGLLCQFFSKEDSLATTVIFAFLPTWVSNSVDVVRDPLCWFFTLYGLLWLARGLHEQRRLLLSLSCLAFLLAACARIEALWHIAGTSIFLLLFPFPRHHRLITIFWFCLPLLVGGVALSLASLVLDLSSLLTMSRLQELLQTVASGIPQYTSLRATLDNLRLSAQSPLLFFLPEARNLIWLIGIGTIANRLFEAMSYPFTIIALSGISLFPQRSQKQEIAKLFCILTAGAFTLLYIRVLQTWIMEYRYLMLAILPATLFFCAGLGKHADRLAQRFAINRLPVVIGLTLLLVVSTLPKNLQARGESETAFKEIGLFLATRHTPDNEINIATSNYTNRLVHLYANLDRPGAPCPEQPENLYAAALGKSPEYLTRNLRQKKIDYLLWEENNRPRGWPLLLEEQVKKGELQKLGHWHNHQTGAMILYKVNPEQ